MTVERLEKKLGIRASDTAAIRFDNCRIPKENLLGDPDVSVEKGFAGAMQTFDNTRPVVAGMAIGVASAALQKTRELIALTGTDLEYHHQTWTQPAVTRELQLMEAELEAARLLTLRAAWMADNGLPNSKEASIAKPKLAAWATWSPCAASNSAAALAMAKLNYWKNGPGTQRFSTSLKAPNRSSY